MGLDYKALATAGQKEVRKNRRPVIEYPEGEIVDWYGYKRHNIEVAGCKGFIVEPPNPAPGLPWSWCIQWAEAFVPRTPALKLLDRGFHHVFLDVFSTYCNPEGIKKLEIFYNLLQSLNFHPQMALTGMSYGGLFSFRWAEEHPETVACIYADAPVCDLGFMANRTPQDCKPELLERYLSEGDRNAAAYGVKPCELSAHPLSPINNYMAIAKAQIPIFAVRSGQDLTVLPETNIDVFAKKVNDAGGNVEVFRRDGYGHHPHGFDDPQIVVDFILSNYPSF